jgi:hypothetical protein
MGYSAGALALLQDWIGSIVPSDGSILELGCQELDQGISNQQICGILQKIHERPFTPKEAEHIATDSNGTRKTYYLFKNSPIDCRYVDLYGDDWGIIADLNSYNVPSKYMGKFDLTTNIGTTEHIFNQACAFKCIHDFTKRNGHMFHSVPFCGYYNHGLYNYHPIFFLFLANANNYKIVALNITTPHLRYTIPKSLAITGAKNWKGNIIDSGILNCILQKNEDTSFKIFTDFDRSTIEDPSALLPELAEVLESRYDLRVRE